MRLSRAGSDGEVLAYEAGRLHRKAARRFPGAARLPALWLVTDPERTPDPLAAAARLPRGAGVIYRAFGAPDAEANARALAGLARRRGLVLLVGADPRLAARVAAHGVHLPERLARLARPIKAHRPGWIVTAAAHSSRALRPAGADAVLLSPVFTSASPSATGVRPWGALRGAALARSAPLPVYALGGVRGTTARRLRGFAGIAAVEALTPLAT